MELKYRVAIMDDEPVIRRGIKNDLNRSGIYARIASSTNQLMNIVRSDHFDAGVIDIKMSKEGTEGLDAVEEIRRIRPGMYIEVLTAFKEFKNEAYSRGADLVLIKAEKKKDGAEEARRIKTGIISKRWSQLSKIIGIDIPDAKKRFDGIDFYNAGWATIGAEIFSKFALQFFSTLNVDNKDLGLSDQAMQELKRSIGQTMIDIVLDKPGKAEKEIKMFEDQLLIDPSLESDENFIAFMEQKDKLRIEFGTKNIFVAFIDGKLCRASPDEDKLCREIDQQFPKKAAFVKKLDSVEKELDLHRPKRVLKEV
jgi:CheY-like chemotaxis protein